MLGRESRSVLSHRLLGLTGIGWINAQMPTVDEWTNALHWDTVRHSLDQLGLADRL
jgi:hypothetical protein